MSVILKTVRLLLRPPRAADIHHFVPLLDDFAVSKNLTGVPHPYTEDDACAFAVVVADGWRHGTGYAFAIRRKADTAFLGICGVHSAEGWNLGYWLGQPYWHRGYATEAGGTVAGFAFDRLGATRLHAARILDNPASGRVLEKLGFVPDSNEMLPCLSRGTAVFCHKVVLTRDGLARRKEQR